MPQVYDIFTNYGSLKPKPELMLNNKNEVSNKSLPFVILK